jgi:hypothetical protein
MSFNDPKLFEAEVRNVARALWRPIGYSGALTIDGRERDGVFFTEDVIHIVECTTSKKQQNVIENLSKTKKLIERLSIEYPSFAVKGWYITLNDATGEQAQVISRYRGVINCLSYDEFRAKLINAREYLECRKNYYFGSVRSLSDGSDSVPRADYVPAILLDQIRDRNVTFKNFIKNIKVNNETIFILGDYGSGKSMTLREIYFTMEMDFLRKSTSKFPVYINLRDHSEQDDPDEALRRHATKFGFSRPDHLVRAWRAGYIFLILDGFDELVPRVNVRKVSAIRDVRYNSVTLVRRFIRESPKGMSIIVAGRTHFFDSIEELEAALKPKGSSLEVYSVNDFNEEQVDAFLQKMKVSRSVPRWLPTRPLLVGYLAARQVLEKLSDIEQEDLAIGWDELLGAICEREADQIEIGLFPDELRRIIERIASISRKKALVTGPVTPSDLRQAFREVCNAEAEDRTLQALLRLPGLGSGAMLKGKVGAVEATSGGREFIDVDFANAAAAGDVAWFANDPYSETHKLLFDGIQHPLNAVGISVLSRKVSSHGKSRLSVAARKAANDYRLDVFCSDLVRAISELRFNCQGEGIIISNIIFDDVDLDCSHSDISNVTFRNCYFQNIIINAPANLRFMPFFDDCYFSMLNFNGDFSDLSEKRASGTCVFDNVISEQQTNSDILSLDILDGEKAFLTILKKIFDQKGSGRRESAFYKGIPQVVVEYIPGAVKLLHSESAIYPVKTGGDEIVWHPVKGFIGEARSILKHAPYCENAIYLRAKKL